jgi:hypothetical protein
MPSPSSHILASFPEKLSLSHSIHSKINDKRTSKINAMQIPHIKPNKKDPTSSIASANLQPTSNTWSQMSTHLPTSDSGPSMNHKVRNIPRRCTYSPQRAKLGKSLSPVPSLTPTFSHPRYYKCIKPNYVAFVKLFFLAVQDIATYFCAPISWPLNSAR